MTIVVSADSIYVDPSALLKLYLREPESRAMATWRTKIGGALLLTHHGRVELINAMGLAAHRRLIRDEAYTAALEALDDDMERGRYRLADILWRATLKRAGDLSRRHTCSIGCRSLDVIHVSSALELGLKHFVSFDLRQQKLALATGLSVLVPSI